MPEMWICYLVCACVANLARSELFTAMVDLERALYAERDIARELKENVRLEEERLALLKSIADDYEKHSSNALSNPNFYLGNPVNAFLLVKRFTLDWDKVSHLLKNSSVDDIISRIHIYRQDLPGIEDLNGAAAALLRLQDTYKLETAEIARGNIAGVRSTELSADECFELGRYAYIEKDYYHTVMWMQEALDRESQEESTVDRASVLDYLAFAMSMQGNTRHALFLTNELLNLDPTHERARNNKQYYERIINDEMSNSEKRGDDGELPIKNIRKLDPYRNSEEYFTYESLCRGEVTKKLKDAHKLKCRYVDHRSPFLKLAPAKEEEIHLQPWIVMYHDVISDREIETVKELATPRLNRATVQNSVTGKLEFANYRISKSAWLKNEHHPAIVKINSRIESITGLNMNTAEELQVANYGIGGHYEPHFDFARKEEVNAFKRFGHGNRIATFLFYMSDVEAGGATVFPYLGVKVFPKKGAAAFWYNLYKNGEGIYDTRHAACPVLVGRKWVSNKWIHERGQEFRRPCSLAEFE